MGEGLAAVRIRVVDAVAARHGFPTAVPALGAGRQVLRRTDVELVATVRAAVRARGNVASCWDWVRHDGGAALRVARQTPKKCGAPPDLRGAWLSRAIAKIVPKPGLGVGHCGRPKRSRSLGRRPLPRLPLLAGRRASSSGLVSPPKLRRCESDSSGTERGAYPERAMRVMRPSTGSEQGGGAPTLARSGAGRGWRRLARLLYGVREGIKLCAGSVAVHSRGFGPQGEEAGDVVFPCLARR
jgi:hypothetical protein